MAPVVCVAAIATAWSFNLERRFIGGDIFEPMNPGAGNRVQAEQLKGASLAGRIKTLQAGCAARRSFRRRYNRRGRTQQLRVYAEEALIWPRSHRKHGETPHRLTATEAVCVSDAAS